MINIAIEFSPRNEFFANVNYIQTQCTVSEIVRQSVFYVMRLSVLNYFHVINRRLFFLGSTFFKAIIQCIYLFYKS